MNKYLPAVAMNVITVAVPGVTGTTTVGAIPVAVIGEMETITAGIGFGGLLS